MHADYRIKGATMATTFNPPSPYFKIVIQKGDHTITLIGGWYDIWFHNEHLEGTMHFAEALKTFEGYTK